MSTNRINPIESTDRMTFKKRRESAHESFAKKLSYAQNKYNDSKDNHRKRRKR